MRIIVETMTRAQAAASRRPELREMKCVIMQPEMAPKQYWRNNYTGYTDDLEAAGLYSVPDMLSGTSSAYAYNILFIKEVEPEPRPDGKVRKRRADLTLGHSLLAMVQASPNNPQVRAHVMAKCKVMPSDALDTAQKIVDWIECDLEMPGEVKATARTVGVDYAVPAPPPPTEAFIVMTRNSETERGSCNYSQVNTSQSAVPIDRTLIASLVTDHPDDLGEIIDAISEHIDEHAAQYERMHESHSMSYDDHEAVDYDNREVEFSRRELTTQVSTYLRNTLTREQLDELGL